MGHARVRFKISTFCMIWKDTIFSVISILNFFKSNGSQTFIKTKIILKSNTIVFDPFNLFVFVNICLLVLFKKFNMDITEKMVSFQIIQNVINVKTTLNSAAHCLRILDFFPSRKYDLFFIGCIYLSWIRLLELLFIQWRQSFTYFMNHGNCSMWIE